MIDRLFFAALTFCLFAGTALAVVGAPFGGHAAAQTLAPGREVQLPYVLVVGKRIAPARTLARTEAAEPATQRAQ